MIKSLVFILTFLCSFLMQAQQNNHNLLIGTYTKSCESNGIYVYDFNSETGDFQLKSSTKKVINPSFLALSPDKKYVYCVNEDGDKSQISAFKYEAGSGKFSFLNAVSSLGNDPCHILTDGKNVIVSNYSGGSLVVLKKNEDGSLSGDNEVNQFSGSSINKSRQGKPHIHQAVLSPDNKYLLVADLGSDAIYSYQYHPESEKGTLKSKKVNFVKPGSGPRHLAFSADGKFVYTIHELDGSICVYRFNKGELSLSYSTTIIPKAGDEISCAEIALSKDGNYLYTTNRGTFNTITCYKIKNNGKLEYVQMTKTLGKGPRSFAIDPSGNFLLIAHQYSNDIVVFKIDKTTGMLTDTDKKLDLCSPVCLVFE